MISLPIGCSVNYEITVAVSSIPNDFISWWEEIGGRVEWIKTYTRTKEIPIPQLTYGNGRPSHKMAGQDEYLIRLKGEDAGVALMLLLKWDKLVVRHNMQEVERMKEAHYG